ncbi:uncharacterized protein [Temnothorax longispinosus]|uniref:uncharacterized protein n=1 Tax=Temnothorax longispinosus TaxID=300112 RepID=UPI003A99395B
MSFLSPQIEVDELKKRQEARDKKQDCRLTQSTPRIRVVTFISNTLYIHSEKIKIVISKFRIEAKDKKKMERRGAISKKNLPKVRENIDVTKAWEENRPVLPIGTKILYEKQEKMVAKMDNSMQMLDKVMTKATEMMENMVEVSRLNLEKEKVKLRRLELEAETKNENREKLEKPEVRVQRAAAEENMKQVKCYRCNRMGHMAKDCPLIEFGAWFCYYCQEVRGHKSDNCPSAETQANRARGKGI